MSPLRYLHLPLGSAVYALALLRGHGKRRLYRASVPGRLETGVPRRGHLAQVFEGVDLVGIEPRTVSASVARYGCAMMMARISAMTGANKPDGIIVM